MLPNEDDLFGAAFGINRLHSLYNVDIKELVENGVIMAQFGPLAGSLKVSNKAVAQLSSYDLLVLAESAKFGDYLHNMADFAIAAVEKLDRTDIGDELFKVKVEREAAIKIKEKNVLYHDQMVVS